jgi:hypothetical protein
VRRQGAQSIPAIKSIHQKINNLNNRILPKAIKGISAAAPLFAVFAGLLVLWVGVESLSVSSDPY